MSFPPPPTHAGDACWPGVKECVVHNGYAYRSLARHDPHSREVIPERENFYSVGSPMPMGAVPRHLRSCDARHVCAASPWATFAIVFADGPRKVQTVQVFLQDRQTTYDPRHTSTEKKENMQQPSPGRRWNGPPPAPPPTAATCRPTRPTPTYYFDSACPTLTDASVSKPLISTRIPAVMHSHSVTVTAAARSPATVLRG
jgi:hypothetical protein